MATLAWLVEAGSHRPREVARNCLEDLSVAPTLQTLRVAAPPEPSRLSSAAPRWDRQKLYRVSQIFIVVFAGGRNCKVFGLWKVCHSWQVFKKGMHVSEHFSEGVKVRCKQHERIVNAK